MTPTNLGNAQSSTGGQRDKQPIQSSTAAKPVTGRRSPYSDYRLKALPTKLNEQASRPTTSGQEDVALNFDNADVKEVIAAISELTGIK